MRASPLLLPALLWPLLGPEAQAADFWSVWGDGKAEVSGYRLVQPRYGHPREGHAVLIYVTEDFSDSARVKADPGKHEARDVYPVLKLNAVRKFPTGIYDYSVMTSVFARVDAAAGERHLAVRKLSFSAQEWCGHVYHQLLPRGDRLASQSHSYFDGEADEARDLPRPQGGVTEDELPILLRPFAGKEDYLKPGGSVTVPFLSSLLRARLLHRRLKWGRATIARKAGTEVVEIGGGAAGGARGSDRLAAVVYTVAPAGDGDAERGTGTFYFEAAAPHRLLRWRWQGGKLNGEEGTLLRSARLPYWQLNGPGQESYLREIGLVPAGGAPAERAPSPPAGIRPGAPGRR